MSKDSTLEISQNLQEAIKYMISEIGEDGLLKLVKKYQTEKMVKLSIIAIVGKNKEPKNKTHGKEIDW